MLVEVLSGPSASASPAHLPACFTSFLPCGRGVEELQSRCDVKPISGRAGIGGHDPNHLTGFLKTDVAAGLDSVTLRDSFGHSDLEFVRNLGHVLTVTRTSFLSTTAGVKRPCFAAPCEPVVKGRVMTVPMPLFRRYPTARRRDRAGTGFADHLACAAGPGDGIHHCAAW